MPACARDMNATPRFNHAARVTPMPRKRPRKPKASVDAPALAVPDFPREKVREENPAAEDKGTDRSSPAPAPGGASRENRASPLELAADDIARGAAAVRRVRADASDYSAEFESLIDFAQRLGFCEDERLTAPPDTRGHEHEVWFSERDRRVLKATYPNKFGLTLGVHRDATPSQYLRRLALQNRVFDDDIRLIGVWNDRGRLRIVTSQPMIEGRTATDAEMEATLITLRFVPLFADADPLWYRPADRVLAFDAHPRNFVITPAGMVIPIDVNLVSASDDIAARLDAELHRAQHPDVD